MTLKFKPEDFEQAFFETFAEKHNASYIAQKIFDKWLSEQKVVYGQPPEFYDWTVDKCPTDTHTARIICIEPIVKCDHPKEKVQEYFPEDHNYRCECGQRVRPKAYEVVE